MPEKIKNAFDTMEKVERVREKSWCIEKSKNNPNITMELKKKKKLPLVQTAQHFQRMEVLVHKKTHIQIAEKI